MRNLRLAGVAAITLLSTAPARAQLCTTAFGPCANTNQQVLDYIRQADQLVQETTTALQEIQNTIKQPATAFRDLTFDIQELENIAQTANMLTGLAGQIVTNIQADHGYPDISNWHQQVSNEAAAVGLAMKAGAMILNLQPQQLYNDAGQLEILNSQNMVNDGRLKAIQTLGSTAAQAGQAIQQLQAVTTGNQQAMMTWMAAQQDRQYLFHTVEAHDLEITWLSECGDATQLMGAMPAGCQ